MLGTQLGARDQPHRLVLTDVRAGHVIDDLRPADGERPGLVEGDQVDRAGALERLRALDEDAARRTASRADQDRGRRREPERAGAGDDEDRDERGDGVAERWLRAESEPG